ncbi:hypothetical protein N0V90_002357 [Kalmusia sp. IMI 367209]|nr:hypothetical protein N0V90_002357 [Kalmusia sp. IMI 367209]
MSLMRLPFRSVVAASRACARGLSTTSRRQEDLLDILGSSPVARSHPSTQRSSPTSKPAPNPLLGSNFAMNTIGDPNSAAAQMEQSRERANFQKHIYRRWSPGDVYAPHDLSGVEQKKWKKGRKTPQSDAFDTLGINPVTEYKNFTMMSEYMTEMGRIKHSRETGLRPKNQRKIAKAIRRAIGLGLMPSVHRHPLVLKKSSPARFLG